MSSISAERTVIVTGGSRGLGESITREFHSAGYRVIIASRNDTGLAQSLGDRARHVSTDVRKPGDLAAAVNAAIDWSGRLDALVNNAGYSEWKRLEDIDDAFWTNMIDTNLKSVLFATQAAATRMTKGGVIVNISSLAGKRGSANNSVYCASKFGVNGITQALAKELGGRGIRVVAVCPVYLATSGLMDALGEDVAPAGGEDIDVYLANFAATQTALGVLPTEQQVARVCLFLASDAAGAVTGQCINVDCGVLPQ